jgi:hypothetical protein
LQKELDYVSFLGIRSGEEESRIMYSLFGFDVIRDEKSDVDDEELEKKYGIVFNPKTSPWEQWKTDHP